MVTESFLVTALPHTADPAASFHLSLFVTHRLTPDGAEGVVGDFPNVVDWADRLADSTLTLLGRNGGGATVTVQATPLLAAVVAADWPRVFPSDLVVRPWQTPDPTAVPWRSFPAHRMQQHALLVQAASVFSSPVASPTVAGNALTPSVMNSIGLGQFSRRLTVAQLFVPELDLDGMATGFLDDISGGGIVGEGIGTSGFSSGGFAPLTLLTADAHRTRRFYQRPEEQHPYVATPVPGAKGVPVAKPAPDFHERASMLGDVSPLLRRIGLIIDVHVDDTSLLTDLVQIQATLDVPDLDNAIATQPWTACAVVGTAFFITSATGDYTGPLLRLGDEERFRVLDLDPDASGLKLEQYVRTLPRMLASEVNGDPMSSAPPTLRATGFSLARVDRGEALQDRLTGAPAKDAAVVAGTAPPLNLEDLARGIRLEVWDDVSTEWHSLHQRRIDVEVEGAGVVVADGADTGFLQGAALTRADGPNGGVAGADYYTHEVVAGWDGWSLAAPRPGKVVVHEDGEELLLDAPDPDPDPVNPVSVTSRVAPLTLPWLRYGRAYAFRAWTVDLAGNSAPHDVAGPPAPAVAAAASRDAGAAGDTGAARDARGALDRAVREVAASRLGELERDATTVPGRVENRQALDELRTELCVLRPPAVTGPRQGEDVPGLDLTAFAPTGFEDVDHLVRQRLAERRERRRPAAASRRTRIEATFAEHASSGGRLMERTDTQLDPDIYAAALAAAATTDPGLPGLDAGVVALIADLVTTPRPFLRWDPVIEPVVVPRHPYTEAESLLTMVVRSGVEGPSGETGLDMTIVPPATYAAQVLAAHPGLGLVWRSDSQRHVAPPKTSQLEAEFHGMFDAAIGGATATDVRAALAVALRESGTFLDATIADLTTAGARLPQPGIAFHTSPTAEIPDAATPADLERGAGLTPGQYVVHDTDQLVLPYLPDPMAAGVSLVFPDAGRDHHLFWLFAIEGVTAPYPGQWPEPRPFRIVLESGAQLAGRFDGGLIRFQIPPGEQLRMRLSSSLDRSQLDLLGLWHSLPEVLRNLDVLAEAAADGWLWWLTPATEMRLVHAVPRPVEAPRPTILLPFRLPGDTAVALFGGVDLHGPSTERLDVDAAWSEWVDDITKPGPTRIDVVAAAANTTVGYDEDLIVLANQDAELPLPDGTVLRLHKAIHQLGDTRHRDIDYRMRATTRYREYFDPRVVPTPDDLSVVGPVRRIDVPSTARPAKPVVRDVLPLFRWFEETEPEQPFAMRRTRRSGLRLYMDRPWYSSGDGELLGVVLAFGNDAATTDHVSQWGSDPVFLQQGPASRSLLPLVDIVHLFGLDDRPEGGRPVGPPVVRTLVDVPGNPAVWVLGYQPEFSTDRGMWFVDVAIDPGAAIWPFVRLGVARYQPSSLAGLHLSPVVQCDFVPLPPERIATVARTDRRHVRVVVTGPVGVPGGLGSFIATPSFAQLLSASRVMRVRLERKIPEIDTDLGWRTVASQDLPILGFDGTVVSWAGEIELPVSLPPRRPGTSATWRVAVEEWERLPADPDPATGAGGVAVRMVYADHLAL